MNFLESHFWYTKRQRNGILSLVILLISIQAVLYFVDFSTEKESTDKEFAMFQSKLDSLKKIRSSKTQRKIYPFNPNYLTDFKGYQLGLNVEEIDRLFRFREQGRFVNSDKEFQKVTGIHDSLLQRISPYFKFPKWAGNNTFKNKRISKISIPKNARDLNKVNAEEIESVKIVNHKMAKRIIAYRNLLQGFSYNEQLFEVYYLKKETADKLLNFFKVIDKPKLNKININNASFKELVNTPYLDYQLTKKICQYRDQNDFFLNLEELKKIDSFPLEKFDRIALYLLVE